MEICAVFYHKEPDVSQTSRHMAFTKCFQPLESEATQVQTSEVTYCLVGLFSEAKCNKTDRRTLLQIMRNFQLEMDKDGCLSTDPGSGFVGGGGQEQRGGSSFQVWQGDRHVSVD